MSLINEALKKARLEAAQRDTAQRGVLVPKATAYTPRRRGGRIAAVAAAGALALALAAAGGMWLAGRSAGGGEASGQIAETPAAEAPGAPSTATGMPAAAGRAAAALPTGSGPSLAGEPPPAPSAVSVEPPPTAPAAPPRTDPAPATLNRTEETTPSRPAPAATETDPAMPRRPPTARTGPGAATPRHSPAATAQPARPAAPAGAESGYLREAPLPGGGVIRLDGIAWSETTPAAVLDGQIVGPGERIHGVRVARVERDRVVLEVEGSEIVVRLR